MFLKAPEVTGVNLPVDEDRIPLWKVSSGDELILTTLLKLRDGTPVDYDNSILTFVLSQNRFSHTPYWTGVWRDGIELVDAKDHPGLVRIHIPSSIGDYLRRGIYNFSIKITDKLGVHELVTLSGSMQVEYETASPEHNIPYRQHPWEN
jgi:hypothetical protein